MGVSLNGIDDGPSLVDSMSFDEGVGVTTCVVNSNVFAMTPLRVTLTCSEVVAGVYGPNGISTFTTAEDNSP